MIVAQMDTYNYVKFVKENFTATMNFYMSKIDYKILLCNA